MMVHLKHEIKKEQNERQSLKVNLGAFALGTSSTFLALLTLRVLRAATRFPATCSWIRSLHEQACQLIGAKCLEEPYNLREEIGAPLPWLARGGGALYLNPLAETCFEMSDIMHDLALLELSSRCAETCIPRSHPNLQLTDPATLVLTDAPALTSVSTPSVGSTGACCRGLLMDDALQHEWIVEAY